MLVLRWTLNGNARDLNRPSSERGVGHLEALGNALGEVSSTSLIALGGRERRKKNAFPRQICGGLSHIHGHVQEAECKKIHAGIYKHWLLSAAA
jgi:hypothetical protein